MGVLCWLLFREKKYEHSRMSTADVLTVGTKQITSHTYMQVIIVGFLYRTVLIVYITTFELTDAVSTVQKGTIGELM